MCLEETQTTTFVHYLHFSGYYPHLCRHVYQRFGRCTLWPSSGGWNVVLNPLFHSPE